MIELGRDELDHPREVVRNRHVQRYANMTSLNSSSCKNRSAAEHSSLSKSPKREEMKNMERLGYEQQLDTLLSLNNEEIEELERIS